jgi:flagellar assembly protein FliH
LSEKAEVTPLRLAEIGPARKAAAGLGNLALLQPAPAAARPVVRSFEQQAVDCLSQARERASQVEREAYEHGFAQGEKDGQKMGEKRFEATAKALTKLLAELSGLRREVLRALGGELADLALEAARAVIRAEVSCGPEVARRALQEAVAALAKDCPVTVRLNPRELAYLREKGLLPEEGSFEPDPKITPGGCLAESERERFDARLERQMERLSDALRQEMAHHREGAVEGG